MISIAVRGYGIVIWHAGGEWRTYTASAAMSATLASRVQMALGGSGPTATEEEVCAALLSIRGAHLLAVDCDHGPGTCDDDALQN